MTGPLGFGYQDWGRTFATSRFFLVPYFNTTITAAETLGPYTVGNMDSIGVRVLAGTGHGSITLRWTNDEAGTQTTTVDVISVRQGGEFDQSVVVKGSFLYIDVANVEPANWTLTMVLYETTRSVIPNTTSVDNILGSNLAQAVGAGATVTISFGRLWAGPATWHATTALATWQAVLEAINENGTVTHIDFQNQATPTDPRPVYLPSCSVQLRLVNSTGAAGNMAYRLLAQPGLSGM